MSRRARVSRGAAAVELVIVLPVVLALTLGTIEWGWYLDREVAVTQAARDAAFAGGLTSVDDDPVTVATARMGDALERLSLPDADIDVDLATTAWGPVLTVRAEVPYAPLITGVATPGRLAAHHSVLLEDR